MATNIKNLNYCKLYARIDDEEKRQFMMSDLVLYQPDTNSFEVRFRNKLCLNADENQAQVVYIELDDISCKKGNIKHLLEYSF
jgi:hypothetical protein